MSGKNHWIEVTYTSVTCWVFAGLGDLAVFVALRMQRPDLVTLALLASIGLSFLGFHNVKEYYRYWAPRYIKWNSRYYYDGEFQATGQSTWDFWMFFGILHMMAMGGIVSCGILIVGLIGKIGG